MAKTKKKKISPLKKTMFKINDRVLVIAGRSKGKTGTILRINRERAHVFVKDVNLVKKAVKKRSQDEQGGIIEIEAPIHISNIALQTKAGQRTRIGVAIDSEGKRSRIAKKSQEQI